MLKNKTVRNIFLMLCCFVICVTSAYAESCSKGGTTQNKYTASGCSYTTQTRTCCANYQWSEWGKDCMEKHTVSIVTCEQFCRIKNGISTNRPAFFF